MEAMNPLRVYKQTGVKTASGGRLIVMLYDECIKQLRSACRELDAQHPKLDLAHNAIVKAQDILAELMISLDFERGGDIAQNLFRLYMYFNQKLVDANLSKKSSNLKEVCSHMTTLREAWDSVEITSGARETREKGGINLAG